MTDETEIDTDTDEGEVEIDFSEPYPNILNSPDGQAHFGVDAQAFLIHWLGKIGHGVEGAALIFGEQCSVGIIHPETGEVLTPMEIAKRAKAGTVRQLQ